MTSESEFSFSNINVTAMYSSVILLEGGEPVWELLPKSKYEMMRTCNIREGGFYVFWLFHIFSSSPLAY